MPVPAHGRDRWEDEDLGTQRQGDAEDQEADRDDGWDDVALRAVQTWLDVEGDDELAEAQREVLVAVAQEALAKKAQREAREEAARRRRDDHDRAVALAEVQRREAARREEATRLRFADVTRAARAEEALRAAQRQEALRREEAQRQPVRREALRKEDLREVAGARRPAATAPRVASPSAIAQPATRRIPPDAARPAARELRAEAVTKGRPEDRVVGAPTAGKSTTGLVEAEALPELTGADLACWRGRLGLTQQAAADRLGVRQGTVSKAESRGASPLGPSLRQALADALGGARRSA